MGSTPLVSWKVIGTCWKNLSQSWIIIFSVKTVFWDPKTTDPKTSKNWEFWVPHKFILRVSPEGRTLRMAQLKWVKCLCFNHKTEVKTREISQVAGASPWLHDLISMKPFFAEIHRSFSWSSLFDSFNVFENLRHHWWFQQIGWTSHARQVTWTLRGCQRARNLSAGHIKIGPVLSTGWVWRLSNISGATH